MEEIRINNKVLKIEQDDNPPNPREWDNLTRMICFHKRYTLGDPHDYKHEDYTSWEEMGQAIKDQEKPLIIKPLYLYDHSGITISTTPFSCSWDSGQIGFVIITYKEIDTVGSTINEGESWSDYIKRLDDYLEDEIKIYDHFLNGDVYYFEITDEHGEHIESCGGFFGDDWKTNGIMDYIPEEFHAKLKEL